ncbi:Ig-like domain-containing protein [Hymenobacter sp. 5317J-9]|uniref:Ig-like domain-containing protein n=1 Tax=Hymenobacter sp. 5317J-9 TaxID=2932250 RepID=UPI001FD6853C|nr:Ig-like domain-containing protein [Hymenobacter sp. 5317J-9]UOQ96787.1 Ig-like domain-containing protein [Hymenobacter sp. 5317J-9]
MRTTLRYLLLLPLLLAAWGSQAQTVTLQQESFENALGSTSSQVDLPNTTVLTTAATGSPDSYFLRTSNATVGSDAPGFQSTGVNGSTLPTNVDGSFYWVGEAVKGIEAYAAAPPNPIPPRIGGRITLKPVSIAGYATLQVKVNLFLARAGRVSDRIETDDTLRVQVRFNNTGGWTTVGQLVGDNATPLGSGYWRVDALRDGKSSDDVAAGTQTVGNPFSEFTFDVSGTGSTLQTRIVVAEQGTSEEFGIDNIRVLGVASSNQAPVLTIESSNINYSEGQGAVNITSLLTVSDDGANLTGATISFASAGFDNTEDRLLFTNQNGITGSYVINTGVLTLTGTANVAAYQTALRSIQYQDIDPNDARPGTRTINFSVTDGISSSLPVSRNIAVTSSLNAATGLPYTEEFPATPNGEGTRYGSNHFYTQPTIQFERTDLTQPGGSGRTTFSNMSNTGYWYGVNTETGPVPSVVIGYLETQPINTAGYANLNFAIRLGASTANAAWQTSEYFKAFYRVVGSSTWTPILSFRGTATTANTTTGVMRQDAVASTTTGVPTGTQLTPALADFTVPVPAPAGATIELRLELRNVTAVDEFAFDYLRLTGTLVSPPSVTTGTAGSVTTVSAAINNNSLTNDGGASLSDYGVVYVAGTGTPTTASSKVQAGTTSPGTFPAAFSSSLTGLTPGTQYTARAYAINSAGTAYGSSVTFTTAPNAPVVTAPANGSLTNDNTPTYTGTAQANATVSVIVDGASIGTTTANASGNWTLTQPTALSQGSHTVRATAAINGSAASANSNTNTFTVDAVPPAAPVVTAPANGSTTPTTTPTYSGTAEANATVTVYVDTNPIGTTTANASGNWTLTQPTALSQGSHTVYAKATDTAGNTGPNSATNTFTVDTVAPTVSSSNRQNPAANPTNATSLTYRVTFSEAVTGVTTSSFAFTTTGGITGTIASVASVGGSNGTQYDVTVNSVSGNGTGRLDVKSSGSGITDVAGNALSGGYTGGQTYTVSQSVTVTSVTRLTPSPTATPTVSYQVVFSGSVTGLTTGNFAVTVTSGSISGASVASVSAGPSTTFTVVVNTGSSTSNGTLRLDVNNSTGTTPTITNVPYTAGEQYDITKSFAAGPTLRLLGAGSASGSNNDVTAFVDRVQVQLNGSSTPFANGLQNGGFESNNVLTNNFKKTADGVVASPWNFTSLAGVSRNGSNGFGSTAFEGDAVGLVQSTGGSNGSIEQRLAVPTGSYQVNFQAAQRTNNNISDQVVNVYLLQGAIPVFVGSIQPSTAGFYQSFTSAAFNVTAPALTATVSTTSASPTSTAPIPFSVSFSPLSVGTTFTASDVTVTGGTLTSGSFAGSGAGPYTFTVTPAGTGTVSVSLAANVAQDANNTGNDASNSVSVQYNQPVTATPTLTNPVNNGFVRTTQPEYRGTAVPFAAINIFRGGVLTDTTFANSLGNFHKFSTATLADGQYSVYVTATTSGSATSANSNTNTFTVDTTAPTATLTSSTVASNGTTSTSPVNFTATFSEPVTGFTSAGLQVTGGTVTSGPTAGPNNTYTFQVTPGGAGSVTVQVRANAAQDPAGNFNAVSGSYAFAFVAPTIVVNPASLSNGTQGTAYSVSFTAAGGSGSYSYAYSGSVIPGLSFASNTLSGTPTASGTYNFRITATDNSTAPGPYSGFRNYTLTVSTQPVTAAPIVTAPANGALTNNPTPAYSGTASAGSTVTVYVDFTAIGTTTASGTGSFTLPQPTPLADGSHTVYATAQTAGATVSVNSNANSFTVDTARPAVVISSTNGANGSTTSTSPLQFTVTFSESVTGFVAGGVSVGNGTLSGFAGSGNTYTVSVTPTTAGTPTTVNIAANVGQDAAGNGNTAAAPFAITYLAPITATVWTGAVSTDWFTAGNWTAGVPTATVDATIQTGSARYPALTTGTATAKNLTIGTGASLTHTGGTLSLTGDFLNNGTYTGFNATSGGTVALNGTGLQTLGGSSPLRFWNLSVGASGAAQSVAVDVARVLTLTGNLSTGGQPLTLLSSAQGDALVNNAGGVVNGTATVQRYIDPSLNAGLGYRHYAAPVANTTVADLATSGFAPVVNPAYNISPTPSLVNPFPTVFGYDQSRLTVTSNYAPFDKGFFSPALPSDPLAVGRGYTVNLSASQLVDFVGLLNNGTVTVPLASNRASFPDGGWQLLGNPYPAPLDYSTVPAGDRVNLEGAIYVYSSTSQYNGQYRSYVNGVGGNPVIPSGQGFFARVAAGQSTGSITFRNANRLTAPSSTTFQRGTAETRPLVQLTLRGATGTASDEAYVYFQAGATARVDAQYDAVKLPNTTGLNLASLAAGTPLAINGLPYPNAATLTVPLAVAVPVTGTYSLTAAQVLNFPAGAQPYLRDLQLGTLTDLRLTPAYTFTQNAANTAARFELVFGPQQVLGAASASLAAQVALFPNPATQNVYVELPPSLSRTPGTAGLVDALGRTVLTQALPAGLSRHTLPLTNLATGVYSLRLLTEAGVVVKRLVVE